MRIWSILPVPAQSRANACASCSAISARIATASAYSSLNASSPRIARKNALRCGIVSSSHTSAGNSPARIIEINRCLFAASTVGRLLLCARMRALCRSTGLRMSTGTSGVGNGSTGFTSRRLRVLADLAGDCLGFVVFMSHLHKKCMKSRFRRCSTHGAVLRVAAVGVAPRM